MDSKEVYTRSRRKIKSPNVYESARIDSPVSPKRGRSRSNTRAPRSRSRTPAARSPSRSKAKSQTASVRKNEKSFNVASEIVSSPVSDAKQQLNNSSNSVSVVNGAQKWKANFTKFKPSISIDKELILSRFIDLLKINFSVALTTLFTVTIIFSYLLCYKNRCKLPTKIPPFSKLTFDVTPHSAYIFSGFLLLEFLFTFIPKRSNIISFLSTITPVIALYFYPLYPVMSILDKPVEFIQLSLIASLVVGAILFLKGFKKSNDETTDKLMYGFLFGFKVNSTVFGKNIKQILHQISFIQLAVLDVLFAIKVYELNFPILFTAALALHFLFVFEKICFATKKDYIDLNNGLYTVFFSLIYPAVSTISLYAASKNALKEHSFYEYAGVATVFWIFGFYVYCKAKYDPPRRLPSRSIKGLKSRLAYIWNFILTSPWVGQSIIELSIAGAILPYSYFSLISTVSYLILTKVVPTLY